MGLRILRSISSSLLSNSFSFIAFKAILWGKFLFYYVVLFHLLNKNIKSVQIGNNYHGTWQIWNMGNARQFSVRDFLTQVLVDRHAVLSGVSYVAVLSKAFVLVIL